MAESSNDLKKPHSYLDLQNPAALTGVTSFLKNNPSEASDRLRNEILGLPDYSLFRTPKKNFQRRAFLFHFIDDVWAIDLLILTKYKNLPANKKKANVLVCIDAFSRFAFAEPLKDKTGATVTKAFEKILQRSGRIPQRVFADAGSEFRNRLFSALLKKHNIKLYHTGTGVKASPVERLLRSLMTRMARIWYRQKSFAWVPHLQSVIDSYNQTIHSSHQLKPSQVNKSNESEVWYRLHKKLMLKKPKPPKFAVGDRVLVSLQKLNWEKGYSRSYSETIFTVSKVRFTRPVPVFELAGILGTFYTEELQLVHSDGVQN